MKEYLFLGGVMLALLLALGLQHKRIERLTNERDRYKGNSEALMGDVEYFKVRDSLNGAKVQGLELTIKEYERFRAEDASLIKTLQARNRDLTQVNKTQSETIIDLLAIPRDTIIIRDSVPIPAIALHCGDEWYDFDGILTQGEFSGNLTNRDSLLLAETVKYKRFLGFLWRTKQIQDRELNVVSRNPHTSILGVEHIVLEKK